MFEALCFAGFAGIVVSAVLIFISHAKKKSIVAPYALFFVCTAIFGASAFLLVSGTEESAENPSIPPESTQNIIQEPKQAEPSSKMMPIPSESTQPPAPEPTQTAEPKPPKESKDAAGTRNTPKPVRAPSETVFSTPSPTPVPAPQSTPAPSQAPAPTPTRAPAEAQPPVSAKTQAPATPLPDKAPVWIQEPAAAQTPTRVPATQNPAPVVSIAPATQPPAQQTQASALVGNQGSAVSGDRAAKFAAGQVLATLASNNDDDPVYHTRDCRSAQRINTSDEYWYRSAQDAINDGRRICGNCNR